MSDVVVTVPKRRWREWLDEGDLAPDNGSPLRFPRYMDPSEGLYELAFRGRNRPRRIDLGERVYIVSHSCLRGSLVRRDGAVAVTVDQKIDGFRGFRYRWWDRSEEYPFRDWRTELVA